MKDKNDISDWLKYCEKQEPIIPDNPRISLADFPIQKRYMKLSERKLFINLFGNNNY